MSIVYWRFAIIGGSIVAALVGLFLSHDVFVAVTAGVCVLVVLAVVRSGTVARKAHSG